MKFVYPEFLYALFAIAIPILIHLFNFRKFKKVYFSNVQFLKEVKEQTQSQSKLKHILVLISRILAISFLVLAFCQPYIPNESTVNTANKLTGIYIDNSFSMENIGSNGRLLDEAKRRAVNIIESHQASDKFVVCDNSFQAKSQRILSKEDAIAAAENITISNESRELSSCIDRIVSALNNTENPEKENIYLISDFQQSTSDLQRIQDKTSQFFLIPIKATTVSNLFIDSCWFEQPTHRINQQEQLKVSIKNNSDKNLQNIPIKLYINNQLVNPTSFNIEANSETTINLNFTNKLTGKQQGKIELRDSPVTFDDSYYFSYTVSDEINVIEIREEGADSVLKAIFSTDSLFAFNSYTTKQTDYAALNKGNLILLNQLNSISGGLANTIKNYLDNHGNVAIIPGKDINYNDYRDFLSLLEINYFEKLDTVPSKIKGISENHPIFKNVFEGSAQPNINLPNIYKHYTLSKNQVQFNSPIVEIAKGNPVVSQYKKQAGNIYLFSTNFDTAFSSFKSHAITVPLLYNMGLYSQQNYPLFFTIGDNGFISLNKVGKDQTFNLVGENLEVIPKTQSSQYSTIIFVDNGISSAGNYTLRGKEFEIGVSFNYNRLESALATYNIEELNTIVTENNLKAKIIEADIETVGTIANQLANEKNYWKLCIILALLFLGIEITLLKLLK